LSIRTTFASYTAERRASWGARTRPVWAALAAPYALFLLFLLVVPFVNVALFSIHAYSPTKILLPELTLDNYRMIMGLMRFHAEGQAAKILPSMWNTLVVAGVVTAVNSMRSPGTLRTNFQGPLPIGFLRNSSSPTRSI